MTEVYVEKRRRYQPGAVWTEFATGDNLILEKRDEEGFLWFEGRVDPLEEKEVSWSGM